jgi:hypothetical protein
MPNTSTALGTDSVTFSFTVTSNASSGAQQYVSQSFQSSVAVFSPVPKIALIQQARGEVNNTGVLTVNATFGNKNASGSLLIAVVSNTGGSAVTSAVTDIAGNTWVQIANPAYAAFNQRLGIFYAPNAIDNNSSNTVTVTFSGGVTNPSFFIYEYRGASTSSPFDASSTQLQANTATPSSGAANPTSSVELVLGVLYSNPSTEIPSAGSGFVRETTSTVSATYVEDMNLFITGPVVANWSYALTTPSSSAVVVTFK